MEPLLVLFFAILPAFIFLCLFMVILEMRTDHRRIWAAFVAGMFVLFTLNILIEVLWVILPWPGQPYALAAYEAYLEAAMLEEGMKFLFALGVLRCVSGPLPDREVILVFLAVSCGYAGMENILYLGSEHWYATALVRAMTAVPGHTFTGVVMGVLWLEAMKRPQRWPYGLLALVVPMALHGTYNFPLMAMDALETQRVEVSQRTWEILNLRFLVAMVLEWALAYALIGHFIRQTKHTWVANGRPYPSVGWYLFNELVWSRKMWLALSVFYAVFAAIGLLIGMAGGDLYTIGFAGYAGLHAAAFHAAARRVKCRALRADYEGS